MRLYRWSIFREVKPDGVYVFREEGPAVEFDGTTYVQTHHGMLLRADESWHATRALAAADAAAKIAEMARILADQAERLTAEATEHEVKT